MNKKMLDVSPESGFSEESEVFSFFCLDEMTTFVI